jgi:Carboxymuconolactone decarboxylase family
VPVTSAPKTYPTRRSTPRRRDRARGAGGDLRQRPAPLPVHAGHGPGPAEPPRLALANGLTQDELVEALTYLAFYAGWPSGMAALTQLKAIIAETGSSASG